MKKLFMALSALVMLSAACKKDEAGKVNPQENSPIGSPSTTSKIPAELVGKWSYGSFSPTNFWNYDGTYAGNAYEQALAFEFHADGTYEEYVINSTTSYNCRTEAYTYFKGKIQVDETNQSFVIIPTSGKYRGFYACAPKSNVNREAKPNELIQERMNYLVEPGKAAIKLSDAENPQGVRLKAVTW
ncbi:hypothetical protein ACFSUS_21340 [Spirosoma soli]|uniref:Lipocalin-like domain-containing protein n=1 Tax=Spirosoma soli TaxID=1770529 RepID=A0ABW5MAV1_9BACT